MAKEESITVTVQMPMSMHDRLTARAEETERSLAGLCRYILNRFIENEEKMEDLDG